MQNVRVFIGVLLLATCLHSAAAYKQDFDLCANGDWLYWTAILAMEMEMPSAVAMLAVRAEC
jgi:hypothetical protein